jgi:LacI family transcriptional regulator
MEENLSRVKISDIASRAGVSTGTVDRVIHNRGEVAAKTREKILGIIRELNYEPDILASTLASKKAVRFASLLPASDEQNPFWAAPAEGIRAAANEIRHYGVVLEEHFFNYHDKNSFSSELQKVIDKKPTGLILAPVYSGETATGMELLKKLNIPVVFINAQVEEQENISYVGQDPFQSGMVAAHLLDFCIHDEAGLFIINITSETLGNTHILNREKGFRHYFSTNNAFRAGHIRTININSELTGEPNKTLEEQLKPQLTASPAGIFVTNSKVFHVASFLEKFNIKTAGLVGYDLLGRNQEFLRNGTIDFLISQKPREQGYKSFMTLFNHMVMKKQAAREQFLPIDIITKENLDFYINY